MTEYAQHAAKTGKYPQFSKLCVLRKILKDTKYNSLNLVRKYSSKFSSSYALRRLLIRTIFALNRAYYLYNLTKTCYRQPLLFILLCYLFRFVNIHCSAWLSRSWGFVVMNHVPRFTVQTATCTADFTSFLIHHLHKMIHHLK